MNESTLQLQRSIIKRCGIRFDHFQRIHILNHAHTIIPERSVPNSQFPHFGTVLQIKALQRNVPLSILPHEEALHAYHHTLQVLQPNQLHLIHVDTAVTPNSHTSQLRKAAKVQLRQLLLVAAPATNH